MKQGSCFKRVALRGIRVGICLDEVVIVHIHVFGTFFEGEPGDDITCRGFGGQARMV